MTRKDFIKKWCKEEYQIIEMKEDLFSLEDHQNQNIAVDILSNIPGAELKLYECKYGDHADGRIAFGKYGNSENGVVVSYSLAVGAHDCDWYELLRILIKNGFKHL